MKKLLKLTYFLIFTLLLSGCSILPGSKKSALSVTTTPQATIFLDGEHLGSTPYYNEKLKSGDYVLKIIPESNGQALNPWEGRITLSPGILTVVNRELGITQDDSSGEILSFEPLADKNAVSISIVTTPDGAVVTLDGEPKGFAPLTIDNISEGEHSITINSTGFKEKTIKAKTTLGNKLIISAQLSRSAVPVDPQPDSTVDSEDEDDEVEEASPTAKKASPTPKPSPKATPSTTTTDTSTTLERPYITINSPDTGWVRVRENPTTAEENELTKVDHDESFPLVDSQNGWYQIEYATGKNGWISGKYAELYR